MTTISLKRHRKHLSILILALLIFGPNLAIADDLQEAKAIFLNYQKLKSQADPTDFGKWFRTTSLLTAMECFHSKFGLEKSQVESALITAGLNALEVKSFLNSGFESTGSYSSPRAGELEQLCAQIASEGFKPFCNTGTPQNTNLVGKKYRYPHEYLVVQSGQTTKVVLNLKCAVTFETTTKGEVTFIDSIQNQNYQVHGADVLSLESAGVTKWASDRTPIYISISAKTLPAEYREASPLNLADGKQAPDVMATSLALKIKSLPTTFSWLMVIEPD